MNHLMLKGNWLCLISVVCERFMCVCVCVFNTACITKRTHVRGSQTKSANPLKTIFRGLITKQPLPRFTWGLPFLYDDAELRRNPGWTCNQKLPTHWPHAHVCVSLCCCYCDIKQTGDLHYSLGQQAHRERGCHGNGPLHGCQNCLIIQDHHHWVSAGNQQVRLNWLNGKIKKLYNVASWGIQMKFFGIYSTVRL